MRCAHKNLETCYYQYYEARHEIIDEDGFRSGQFRQGYTAPVEFRCNVRPSDNYVQTFVFGDSVLCDYVIMFPVGRVNILRGMRWIVRNRPHKVVRILITQNLVRLALREAEMDGSD